MLHNSLYLYSYIDSIQIGNKIVGILHIDSVLQDKLGGILVDVRVYYLQVGRGSAHLNGRSVHVKYLTDNKILLCILCV